MTKAVYADLSFHKCYWTVDTLLDAIEVYVKAASAVCNRYNEALTLIGCEWGADTEEYIRCQGFIKRLLKLIASVTNQCNIPDLKTGLFLANTQAIRRIMEKKTFHSRRLFLTPQD